MNQKHIGASFEEVFAETGDLDEIYTRSCKRIVAEQVRRLMEQQGLSKADLAKKMSMLPAVVRRILDPEDIDVELVTLIAAARALGAGLDVQIREFAKEALEAKAQRDAAAEEQADPRMRTPTCCFACKEPSPVRSELPHKIKIGERMLCGKVPAHTCAKCGESTIPLVALQRFELCVAEALLAMGDWSGESLRFVRKALGYGKRELADLLGVTLEMVPLWETDARPADPTIVGTLAGLVAEGLTGKTALRDMLRAQGKSKAMPESVDLGSIVVPPRWQASY